MDDNIKQYDQEFRQLQLEQAIKRKEQEIMGQVKNSIYNGMSTMVGTPAMPSADVEAEKDDYYQRKLKKTPQNILQERIKSVEEDLAALKDMSRKYADVKIAVGSVVYVKGSTDKYLVSDVAVNSQGVQFELMGIRGGRYESVENVILYDSTTEAIYE